MKKYIPVKKDFFRLKLCAHTRIHPFFHRFRLSKLYQPLNIQSLVHISTTFLDHRTSISSRVDRVDWLLSLLSTIHTFQGCSSVTSVTWLWCYASGCGLLIGLSPQHDQVKTRGLSTELSY